MRFPLRWSRSRAAFFAPARRLAAATLLATVGLAACSSDDATAPSKTVTTIKVAPRVTELRIGGTQQLTAEVLDQDGQVMTGKSVTWTSLNPTVASVNASGLVTMLTDGSTAITATVDGKPWGKTPPAPTLPADVIEKTAAKYREALTRLTA